MKKTYKLLSLLSLVFLNSNMYSMKLKNTNDPKVYLFKVENKTNDAVRIYTNKNKYLEINKENTSFISHEIKTKKDFIKDKPNKCELPVIYFAYPILIKNTKNKPLAELAYIKEKDSSNSFNTLFTLTQSSTQDNIDICITEEKLYESK